jgi:mannose-6-phosphate isomerase-like protein (cupin superfamily)
MSYTTVNYHDVNAVSDAIHFLRDPLECDRLGVSVIDCEPGWKGRKHDHGDENHEEVYVLVEGEATITVNGETVSMTAGDAIRIDPDASRQIRNGDTESTFVVAGAP